MSKDIIIEMKEKESPAISMAQFLESTPPGMKVAVERVGYAKPSRFEVAVMPDPRTISLGGDPDLLLVTPGIQLHCGSSVCGGTRTFACLNQPIHLKVSEDVFLYYKCRNCNESRKNFALKVMLLKEGGGSALKYGEWPPFGPPTPSRLMTLVGPDRDAFLKGRRAENQGLGIGAFAYYRRVVENQKNRLLDEIIRVAERTKAPKELIAILTAAKEETQFSSAVDKVKHSIPPSLLIDGHNPMTLLHKALSQGLHAKTDEACLELATSVRVILEELTENMASALKDHAELKTGVTRLLNRPTEGKEA